MQFAQPNISFIYVSAPTHVAIDNIAKRIHTMAVKICGDLTTSGMLVVRGYDVSVEMRHFFSFFSGVVNDEWLADRWKQPLSLCEWLLKVVTPGAIRSAPRVLTGARTIALPPRWPRLLTQVLSPLPTLS